MTRENKLILIAGASGFLGTYLTTACRAQGFQLLGISETGPNDQLPWIDFARGRLEDVDLTRFLAERDPAACFVLTGGASVANSVLQPAEDFAKLLPGLSKLLGVLSQHHKDCHVILFSSAAVYGNPDALPIREECEIKPLSPYGTHKWLAEELLRHYSNIYGLRGSVLRIFSAYGAGLRRQIFWDLINKYEDSVRQRRFNIVLSGTGMESRDFIHADDVAIAAMLIMQRTTVERYRIYNVANGVGVTIRDAAGIMLGMLRQKVELNFSAMERPGDPRRWQADVQRLEALGFKPAVDLENGLRTYVDWLRRQGKDEL